MFVPPVKVKPHGPYGPWVRVEAKPEPRVSPESEQKEVAEALHAAKEAEDDFQFGEKTATVSAKKKPAVVEFRKRKSSNRNQQLYGAHQLFAVRAENVVVVSCSGTTDSEGRLRALRSESVIELPALDHEQLLERLAAGFGAEHTASDVPSSFSSGARAWCLSPARGGSAALRSRHAVCLCARSSDSPHSSQQQACCSAHSPLRQRRRAERERGRSTHLLTAWCEGGQSLTTRGSSRRHCESRTAEMEMEEGDDHPNIDDRDLPFKFASNNDESFDCTAGGTAPRSSHPIYKYVTRTATEWSCKTCERSFKGPRLFNITRHFKRSHPEVFAEAETLKHSDDVASYLAPFISAATNGRIPSPSSVSGNSLSSQPFEASKPQTKQSNPKNSSKKSHEIATHSTAGAQKCIASLISSGVLSYDTLENEDFSKLLCMIPGFSVPNAKDLEGFVEQEIARMRSQLARLLDPSSSSLPSVALSVDVRERTESHPGHIALFGHFYNVEAKSFGKLLIDVVECPDNHPEALISATVNKILRKFTLSVDMPMISRVTTLVMPRLEAQYRKPYINLFTDQCGNQRELDECDYCTVSCCPERLTVIPNRMEPSKVSAGLEQEPLLQRSSYEWICASDQPKHVPCAAQLMNEVMANVFQEDPEISQAVNNVMAIMKRFTSSTELMKSLMERTNGNELRIPRNNRWSSVLGALERFLTLAPQIAAECKSQDWEYLSDDDVELITKVNSLATPILRFTERLQATESPTISLLLPGLLKLIEHLKRVEASPTYATKLISQIRESFSHVFHSGELNYDPIYLVSTLLDRRVAHMTVECDTRKQRKAIIATISEMFPEIRENCETPGNEIVLEDSSPFGFGTVASSISVPSATSLEGSEIMPYFHRFVRLPTSTSSIEFWLEHAQDFPVLSKAAIAILSIPASTIQLGSSLNSNLTTQLENLQSTTLPKTLRSSLLLTCNKSLANADILLASNGTTRSTDSCSPSSGQSQKSYKRQKQQFSAVKQEPESNDEMDSVSTHSWTTQEQLYTIVKQEEEDGVPDLKRPKKQSSLSSRRLSSASSSSKSSGNGCR